MARPTLALACFVIASLFAAVTARADANVAPGALRVTMLPSGAPSAADASTIVAGRRDAEFVRYSYRAARLGNAPFWLRLEPLAPLREAGVASLHVGRGRHLGLELHAGATAPLAPAATWSTFRGQQDMLFALPPSWQPSQPLYLKVTPRGTGAEVLDLRLVPFTTAAVEGVRQSQVIAAAVGALLAMSLAALLIWFILPERLFVLYATLFSLQAVYVAFLSGAGFDWPLLGWATPLAAHAWNVPAALGGAAAALFVREIADLRRVLPRTYVAYGWLAAAFAVLAVANVAHVFGLGAQLASVGNLLFVGTALFTLVVAFIAWRRGSRAAGWFMVAWGLLEAATIATAAGFLVSTGDPWPLAWGLPLSMVVAAVFVALGVADRLREQRLALTDAERRAQSDPLTGVLNRRSLLERLDAACLRAQARGLPISLLFIDLDHFKSINDTWGHQAGDACLLAVIRPIQAELRQSDVIGRYGGEEFVVILSSADSAAAQAIADRILQRVADLRVEGFGAPIRLTCSIGVASSEALGVWGDKLISQADAAVYAAKHSGRNQVRVAALAA